MNMASVSKFVTAIAVVRLLRANNLALTTTIGRFLPQYWTRGTGSDAVTFHALLRHEAGFDAGATDSGNGDFAAAKSAIAKGPTASLVGNYTYRNVNFAILRILFATLTGMLTPASKSPSFFNMTDDTFWDGISGLAYENTVNDTVFAPANIDPHDHSAPPNAALAYATPPATPGAPTADGLGGSGPGGWHLSIGELARLLNEFRAGAMMSRSRAREILAQRYGLDVPFSTRAGTVHWKRGRKLVGQQGMDSGVWLMPGDIDLAVYINSVPAFTPPAQPPSYNDGISQLIIDSVEFVF
jgi:CubicO group peptidase (beta-lactamase class C family)